MSVDRRQFCFTALACGTLLAQPVLAEESYPSKPITVIVSYPPGGDTDAIARLFADKLSRRLKQTVLIDNRPGAGGAIGNGMVGRARADGYTLLFTPNPFTTAPLVMRLSGAASYDVLGGYEAIIKTATQPLVLVTSPSFGIKTLPELIAKAKSGASVTYASPGAGSPMHIVGEWLNKSAGVKITHVPYRGVGPSVTDVVAGHVNTAWVTFGAVRQYLDSGKLIALAIGDSKRSSLGPNVPTLAELGYKDVVVGSWNGFFAPKGTPSSTVTLLNKHLNDILNEPEVVEKLAFFGALPSGGAPAVLSDTNKREYEVMGKAIKDMGIVAE
ncbi:Bug family tripartite tricarboxylate transporter substrate binding protein [Comamonas thiooxydans]|uniref:Bug family tripartite tricarboxylate transporter substrate binding protein n=1 Tax=Comamonas thiooxydans TaxID=363952 RepID=UPI00211491B2|nr:tripartite tricarboxylate transporter substrate binding protein [Comamonas thiooxydans]UUE94357.1 tripartite tricarboxylate transporter substrate binding protein [Comamonas thiooxydans]